MSERHVIRLVRLTLRPEAVEAFMEIFREAAPRIRATPGCLHLELWRDVRYPHIVSTYSRWESEDALQSYRDSEFFRGTWGKTRELFAAPPFAASHHGASE